MPPGKKRANRMRIPIDLEKVFQVACNTDIHTLIIGDTGTGKTTLAKKIHENSQRKSKPFVVVNLATLHEGTLESELFGHERGAFTGADSKRMGRLELADRGTIFLDEIGELSPRLQARLLEFLQSRTIIPVGSNREIRLDVRVIAATHKNLIYSVKKGIFREDLFHRLRVIQLYLKPLVSRRDDFDSILLECLRDLSANQKKRAIQQISPAVLEIFENYSWPGNVRELRNVLEYAIAASEGPEIRVSNLPDWFIENYSASKLGTEDISPPLGTIEVPLHFDFQTTMEGVEKEFLKRALSRNGGRICRTAQQIRMSKTTLLRRIRAYNLKLH